MRHHNWRFGSKNLPLLKDICQFSGHTMSRQASAKAGSHSCAKCSSVPNPRFASFCAAISFANFGIAATREVAVALIDKLALISCAGAGLATLDDYCCALAAAITVLFVRVVVVARDFSVVVTAARFDALRNDHTALRNFLRRMPKGADLHIHLTGAVYAEHVIEWAILDGYCVRTADLTIVPPPCTEGSVAASEAQKDQALYDRLVNALSMRDFRPTDATPSGHDQFFTSFGRLNIAPHRTFELIMDQLVQRQADGVQYVELMLTLLPARDRQTLAKTIEGETDLATMLDTLKRNGLDRAVEEGAPARR